MHALWVKNSSPEEHDKQLNATIAALVGIEPKDELEGMMAAQLFAAHNAAMECYRRAMISEQTFEGRREVFFSPFSMSLPADASDFTPCSGGGEASGFKSVCACRRA